MTLAEGLKSAPVSLQGVTKRFGHDILAVDELDLEIEPGSLVTLLGPSGCGKTTTLRMIAGLERATGGRILIDGADVTKLPANHRDVTMVFQSYALFPHMDVFDNVAYGLRVAGVAGDDLRRRVAEALELVGMEGLERRSPSALSGGQQQRVALARALVMQPRVLLFDEPLSNLDAKLRRRVRHDIRDLQQRLGITSVYVTHDQEEALAISDIILVMHQGRVQQSGTPFELYSRPVNRFVADFIGSASFLPGTFDGKSVTIGDHSFEHAQDLAPGPVTVMVRPEAVRLVETGGLPARVKTVSYLGLATDVLLDTGRGELQAAIVGEGRSELSRGDQVSVELRPAGVYLLPADADGEAPPGAAAAGPGGAAAVRPSAGRRADDGPAGRGSGAA